MKLMALEVLAEWHVFTFETAVLFDTTKRGRKHGGYGNRQGTYQEITFGPGYTDTFTLVQAAGGRGADPLSLTLCGGLGCGTPKRNRYDAGFGQPAGVERVASVASCGGDERDGCAAKRGRN